MFITPSCLMMRGAALRHHRLLLPMPIASIRQGGGGKEGEEKKAFRSYLFSKRVSGAACTRKPAGNKLGTRPRTRHKDGRSMCQSQVCPCDQPATSVA